ncbi:hypothetical protein [Cloacibacillus evryensis]|uniref:Uncharacterized protein n=2 Tax=root TaxID=1 RepID=A0AAW5JZN4_9BACT|nr:hypothetical protein [Cloacibacillus evryensis]EHL71467.1 hypothetical protein HMPREF1006_02794 [Synergistes sp. 3_1_syn1]MCQ4764415.1 hypothetical protein [Cloacibacillus evryensis]MCQ4813642.1 hypothetical protein [Cloacibacillus evryensis]MEA5033922.1 hypothetical protein [Cloacibacillus evryensis]
MTDFSFLAAASDIWEEWRFEPWRSGTAEGLYRRVSMVKSGLLGEVARYYADDYIIWKYEESDADRLRKEAKSESDLLLQRFLFLRGGGGYRMKKSSLMFGFRGFVELHFFTPGDDIPKAVQDTAFLVNAAMKRVRG